MVIFHSYVSLPEGNGYKPKLFMVEALTIFGISYWGDKPMTMLGNMGLYGIILANITQMVIVMGLSPQYDLSPHI
jgi:hypothetical protein